MKFSYEGQEVEIVNQYIYLGIPFSSSSLFSQATKYNINKTNMAITSTMGLLSRAKVNSWEAQSKIFEALVRSVLLYCCSTWSLRYISELDKLYVNYYKRLLNLARSTPSWAVRLETGTFSALCDVLKMTLGWLRKLARMSESRLPRICFGKLVEAHKKSKYPIKYNWFSQLAHLLGSIGCMGMIDIYHPESLTEKSVALVVDHARSISKARDLEALSLSSFSKYYNCTMLLDGCQPYLGCIAPFACIRVFAQARLAGKHIMRLCINRINCSVRTDQQCALCEQGVAEDICHLLFHCPAYSSLRSYLLEFPDVNEDEQRMRMIFERQSRRDVCRFANFVYHILAEREKIKSQ